MPPSPTAPLRRALAGALPSRPFALELWDGTTLPATGDELVRFHARSPRAVTHLLRAPGELGLGRAYVSGDLEPDDVGAALDLLNTWSPPPLGRAARARLVAAAVLAAGPVPPLPRVPSCELPPRGRRHEQERDREAVRHHYDVANELFALFLDASMTYSCAIFSRGATTLEEAQEAKLELVCRKLALQPGDRVLDVGCGWGAFALHAAQRHGAHVVGITISRNQQELARRRVADAGLEDRVEIRLADYRELAGERYDAIASIGMVEHVGEAQIDVYARQLASLLEPGGRLLNHGIARLRHTDPPPGPFNDRYVFPDGETLPLSRVLLALERAGFVTEHVEGFPADYAETLRHWAERLDARLDDAIAVAGEERVRVWRLYLRAARNGFRNGRISVFQTRCRLG